MSGPVVVLQAGQLAPSVLRDALSAGPSGADPAGRVLIGLLEAAGLLDDLGFVEACVTLACEGELLYADLDLGQLAAVSLGEDPLALTPIAHRVLSAGIGLVDLAAGLHGLDPARRAGVVAAVAEFLHAVGPEVGLTVSLPPAEAAVSLVPSAAGGTR